MIKATFPSWVSVAETEKITGNFNPQVFLILAYDTLGEISVKYLKLYNITTCQLQIILLKY